MYRKSKYEVGEIVKIPAAVELLHPSMDNAFNYRQTTEPEIGWIVEDNYNTVKVLTTDDVIWDTNKVNIFTYGE